MRVIFLDCDGVLNYTKWYTSSEYQQLSNIDELDIDPKVVQRLNTLCEQTGASIVVSSSWKIASGWKSRLERAGLKYIVDKTPDYIWYDREDYCRGWEIEDWLKGKQVENYIILDDVQDFYEHQLPHFIHVNPYEGFTDDDLAVALNMLKATPKE